MADQFRLFPLLVAYNHALKYLRENAGSAITDNGNPSDLSSQPGRIQADIINDINSDVYLLVGGNIEDTIKELQNIGFKVEEEYGIPIRGPVELNQRLGHGFAKI